MYGMASFTVSPAHRLFNISVLLVCYFAKQKIEDRCVLSSGFFFPQEGKAPSFSRIKLISSF